jgi:hypothetical protein
MERRPFAIECVRCGETRLELLTEAEERTLNDGVGPVYRQCEQCEKTTGWVKGRGSLESELAYLPLGQSVSNLTASQPVPSGQERMANQSELDEMEDLLQRHPAGRRR